MTTLTAIALGFALGVAVIVLAVLAELRRREGGAR
jgi:hypothetical protein